MNADVDGANAEMVQESTLFWGYASGFGGSDGLILPNLKQTLPETFNYFGQSFSRIYVNENGFLSFGNGDADTDKPWHQASVTSTNPTSDQHPYLGGGRLLQYLVKTKLTQWD